MLRRVLSAGVVLLALLPSTTAARTDTAVGTHKLIVVVAKTLPPRAERRLAVLVLISQHGGAPAGALATPAKPLTVVQNNAGLYRVQAEIDGSCKGSCAASYRIAGSADHELRIVPRCQLRSAGFVCSRVTIVEVY